MKLAQVSEIMNEHVNDRCVSCTSVSYVCFMHCVHLLSLVTGARSQSCTSPSHASRSAKTSERCKPLYTPTLPVHVLVLVHACLACTCTTLQVFADYIDTNRKINDKELILNNYLHRCVHLHLCACTCSCSHNCFLQARSALANVLRHLLA